MTLPGGIIPDQFLPQYGKLDIENIKIWFREISKIYEFLSIPNSGMISIDMIKNQRFLCKLAGQNHFRLTSGYNSLKILALFKILQFRNLLWQFAHFNSKIRASGDGRTKCNGWTIVVCILKGMYLGLWFWNQLVWYVDNLSVYNWNYISFV